MIQPLRSSARHKSYSPYERESSLKTACVCLSVQLSIRPLLGIFIGDRELYRLSRVGLPLAPDSGGAPDDGGTGAAHELRTLKQLKVPLDVELKVEGVVVEEDSDDDDGPA